MKQRRSIKSVKAEQAARKKRVKRRRKAVVLIFELLILLTLLGIGYMMTKYSQFQLNIFEEGDIQINNGAHQEGYTTIALFGGDSREGKLEAGTHADTIMVASIDNETKEVKIVSVYRDLVTKQTDGKIRKANSAYFTGGPKEAINMLNRNFDLDIQDYVTVDFSAMAECVDLMGGVEVDVTEAEAEEMNNYVKETADATKKKANDVNAGFQTLDGVQAVTYARIRKNVGGDYGRTQRQRVIFEKMAEKAKQSDFSTLNEIINRVFSRVSTSFTLKELVGLAANIMQYQLGETSGFAFEHMNQNVEGIGSVVVPLDVEKNVEELHAFLYPKSEYTVSDMVRNIAREIESLTGQEM